jgi:hypothetical protein
MFRGLLCDDLECSVATTQTQTRGMPADQANIDCKHYGIGKNTK